MAFSRATRSTIQARVAADIERASGQSASSRGDVYYPLSQAVAGVSHGLHGHLQYNVEQLFDDSCNDDNLLRRAAEMGIYQIQSYRASGTAKITGNDGAIVLAETLLQTDDETTYRVTEATTIADGEAVINLTAVNAGADGNLDDDTTLRFISTQVDVDSAATVISMAGGSDVEEIARVRERLDDRRVSPAMGGNQTDYTAWAFAAHVDVTRTWCYPLEAGLGTVVVRIVTDDLDTPVATDTHITAVKDYIDENRPVGMKRLYVYAVSLKYLDLEFATLSPNTEAVRTAINVELNDMLLRTAEPGSTIYLSQINEAISLASGEENHALVLTENVTSQAGELLVLGDISWSTE